MTLRQAQGTVDVRFEKRAGVSASWVERVISGTLKAEKRRADLDILITGDVKIRKINKKFLKHDFATDVISFNLVGNGHARSLQGNVVVSADFARRYSKEHDIPYRQELARYLVHGTLHLLGYDDKKRRTGKRCIEGKKIL